MRPATGLPVALIALLAACSSEPAAPGADAAPDATDAAAVDVVSPADIVDASAHADARDAAVGVDAVDAAAVDVPGLDVAVGDAVGDALDVAAADAPALDAPDVADVRPVDTAPADAGPVTWPLDPQPGAVEGHVLYQEACTGGVPCEGPPYSAVPQVTCERSGTVVTFSARACVPTTSPTCVSLTGRFPSYPQSTGATLAIVGAVAVQGRDLRITGGAAGPRQSFHVQFGAPFAGGTPGATGIPGRTVDPTLGDLWLLGCAVR